MIIEDVTFFPVVHLLWSLFSWVIWSLFPTLVIALYVFCTRYKSFNDTQCKYLQLVCSLHFILVRDIFGGTEVFHFNIVQISSSFHHYSLHVLSKQFFPYSCIFPFIRTYWNLMKMRKALTGGKLRACLKNGEGWRTNCWVQVEEWQLLQLTI